MKSTPPCTERQTGSMWLHHSPQPIAGRPQHRYARYNQNERRYPNNRYNYRPKVSYDEGESRATLAVGQSIK